MKIPFFLVFISNTETQKEKDRPTPVDPHFPYELELLSSFLSPPTDITRRNIDQEDYRT